MSAVAEVSDIQDHGRRTVNTSRLVFRGIAHMSMKVTAQGEMKEFLRMRLNQKINYSKIKAEFFNMATVKQRKRYFNFRSRDYKEGKVNHKRRKRRMSSHALRLSNTCVKEKLVMLWENYWRIRIFGES